MNHIYEIGDQLQHIFHLLNIMYIRMSNVCACVWPIVLSLCRFKVHSKFMLYKNEKKTKTQQTVDSIIILS